MKITRFKDIQAWQEARKLVGTVYGLIGRNQEFKRDVRLVNQIQAAAVSTMSNIAEGFARKGIRSSSNVFSFQRVLLLKFRVSSM